MKTKEIEEFFSRRGIKLEEWFSIYISEYSDLTNTNLLEENKVNNKLIIAKDAIISTHEKINTKLVEDTERLKTSVNFEILNEQPVVGDYAYCEQYELVSKVIEYIGGSSRDILLENMPHNSTFDRRQLKKVIILKNVNFYSPKINSEINQLQSELSTLKKENDTLQDSVLALDLKAALKYWEDAKSELSALKDKYNDSETELALAKDCIKTYQSELNTAKESVKEEIRQWLISEDFEGLAERI